MAHAPNSVQARDIAYHAHPFTNLRAHEQQGPMVVAGGQGVWVWDDEGKRYIEGLAGLWCTALGFSEPRLVAAATKQMEKLPYMHLFGHRGHEPATDLAERLIRLTPPSLTKALFCNSGSEAIDTALKLIWYYNNARGKPEKKRIIARKRAYHGTSIAGGHLTGLPYARMGFDLPMSDRFFHLTAPSHYRDGRPGESLDAFTDRLVGEVETLIGALGPETIAAFVAEPVQGAGGVIVPPPGYFPRIQALCRRHDILMVSDEVICGFGRTGNWFGCETVGFTPDMITIAKQLSSAYLPIAGLVMSDAIYQVLADRSNELGTLGLGATYAGHPVAAAVALEALRIYEEDDILGHVREVAPHFQARVRALGDHPLVGEARGIGLLGAVELVQDKGSRAQYAPAAKANAQVVAKCLAHGLMVRPLPGDVIGICPPLIISHDEIDQLFDRLDAGLRDATPVNLPLAA